MPNTKKTKTPTKPKETGFRLKTKFKPGETIWYMHGSKPTESKVVTVTVRIIKDCDIDESIVMANHCTISSGSGAHTREGLGKLIFGL